jgi:hypothetical protein
VYELELLAIVDVVEMFQSRLYGTALTIVTDSKLLNYFMKETTIDRRLTGWKLFLQSYNFTIIQTAEKNNILIDILLGFMRRELPIQRKR